MSKNLAKTRLKNWLIKIHIIVGRFITERYLCNREIRFGELLIKYCNISLARFRKALNLGGIGALVCQLNTLYFFDYLQFAARAISQIRRLRFIETWPQ